MATVTQTLEAYNQQLDALEAESMARLTETAAAGVRRIEALLAQLLLEIGDRRPTRAQLERMREYQRLLAQAGAELTGLTTATANEVERTAQQTYALGLAAALALLFAVTGGAMGSEAGMPITVGRAVPSASDYLAQMLDPSGPLYDRLRLLTDYNAERVAAALLDGILQGFNPRKIARMVQDAFGGGLTDALRTTRTAQLYAYRYANQAEYQAAGIERWAWNCSFNNSCMSCIAQHGTIHPVTELLRDHHNGACDMIPLPDGYDNPIAETGEQWFERQSEADQKRLMGRQYWEAWKGGAFNLSEISDTHEDAVYGPMRGVAPLWKLLGAEPPVRT